MSHHLMPHFTERMSADIVKKESDKGGGRATHTGAIYTPMRDGKGMDRGVRARMKQEDR